MGWNNSSESCVAKYNGDMVGKANFQSCGEIENNRRFEVYALLTLEYKVPIVLVDMEKEKV